MGSQMSGADRAKRRGGGFTKATPADPFENKSEPSPPPENGQDARYRSLVRKSLPELLQIVADSGWLVNNLFQVGGKMWRANLRYILESRDQVRTYFHEFSDAATPEGAMAAAIWNMEQRRNDATRQAGAKNSDIEWASNVPYPKDARKITPDKPTHQLDEVVYIEKWQPDVEKALYELEGDVVHLRAAIKQWTLAL